MSPAAAVLVHPSVFPEAIKEALLASLKNRELHPKFLYLGLKQTLQWLQLHESWSPARLDPGVLEIYQQASAAAAARFETNVVHLVGMAAGGAQKEIQALDLLRRRNKTVFFSPVDASLDIVVTAHRHAVESVPGLQSYPILCDLPACNTFPALLKQIDPGGSPRLVTFYGTIHNFLPGQILPRIMHAVRSQDFLLISANLAPESTYNESLPRLLQQYDNKPTREWLRGALEEIGLDASAGTIEFEIASTPELPALKRIQARFRFTREYKIGLFGSSFEFQADELLRVFFSIRYTATEIRRMLGQFSLDVVEQWIAPSEEEGVFLCRRPVAG